MKGNAVYFCRMRIFGFAAVALLISLGGLAQTKKASFKTTKTLPSFTLTDISNKTFSTKAAQVKGKPLVVIYFSPYCAHCVAFTEELTGDLKSFKGVQFLMASAFSTDDIRTFVVTRGLNKLPSFKVGSDPAFQMGDFYEIREVPGIFVYNSQGKLTHSFSKQIKLEQLKAALKGA
jgi:thiol-disulfide isomerase/thioredoxin